MTSQLSQREVELAQLVFKLPPLGEEELNEAEKSVLRKEYVDILAKYDLLYHFDEMAEDICWDTEPPNQMELQHLNCLTNYLYHDELFALSLESIV